MLERATTIKESLGKEISWFEFASAISEGFRQNLGIDFESGSLTKPELARAKQIFQEKFANDSWTLRI